MDTLLPEPLNDVDRQPGCPSLNSKIPSSSSAPLTMAAGLDGRRQPRTVLVLGGGGMRGMAHVGVLKAMDRLGFKYDAIVGTSIGALVGSMAASGCSIERMEEMVSSLQKEDYFKLNFIKFLLKGVRTSSVSPRRIGTSSGPVPKSTICPETRWDPWMRTNSPPSALPPGRRLPAGSVTAVMVGSGT